MQIILALVCAPFLLLAYTIIYRRFLHPLASIPGPRWASITRLWLAWNTRNGRINRMQQALHDEYGPVVRISPNEVSLSSAEAWRTVYGVHPYYPKAPWYRICNDPAHGGDGDGLDFLTEENMQRYRLQRRIVRPVYSIAGVERHEMKIDAIVSRFMQRLETLQGQYVDLAEWLHICVLDTLANVTLSEDLNYIHAGNDDGNFAAGNGMWRVFSLIGLFPWITEMMQRFPLLETPICKLFGVPSRRPMNIGPWALNNIQARFVDKSDKSDILADLLRLHEENPEWKASYVVGMAMTNFGAGHDTMTASLTAIITCICQDPKYVEGIREEMATTNTTDSPKYEEVAKLPYLQNCIKEAMRLFPVVGQSLPRVVPGDLTIDGHTLPAGTVVGVNPYVLNSQMSTFGDDAAIFNPGRWLDADEGKIRNMDRHMVQWGGASRTCPGQHLAMFVMTKVLVSLFDNFDVQLFMDDRVALHAHFSTHLEGVRATFKLRPGRL